jgi:hypothetical protein
MTDDEYKLRKRLICNGQVSQSQQADKAVLTLSSSAFGLSLAFIRNLAPTNSPDAMWLLVLGWALLVVSAGAVLVSFRLSVEAHIFEDNELECARSNSNYAYRENRAIRWVNRLNWLSLFALILGATMIAAFVVANLK